MPRKQDFSQSTIYHIRNKETKCVVYVGSSCNFTQRQSKHKNSCNNKNDPNHNYPIYVYIREHGGFGCYEVIPVSFHNFDNKVQLRIQEQIEIDKFSHAMNKYKAYITEEQKKEYKKEYLKGYRATYVEQIKEQSKEYRATHAEELKEKIKAYRATHVEEIKEQRKEYYDKNAKELKEKRKAYYATNAKELNEKKKEKIECPLCKKFICKSCLRRHQKTKICMKLRPTPQ